MSNGRPFFVVTLFEINPRQKRFPISASKAPGQNHECYFSCTVKMQKKSSFPFRMFASKVSVHKTFCFEQITLKRKVEAINWWLQVPVVRNLKFRTRYSKAYCPLPKQQCCLVTKTMLTQMLRLKTKTELGTTEL